MFLLFVYDYFSGRMVMVINIKIEDIAKKYNINFLVYFGSYNTPYFNKESDIDIAFLAEKPLSYEKSMELLEELIHYHKKCEIDLVDLNRAEPLIKYEIAKNGREFTLKNFNNDKAATELVDLMEKLI